MPAAFIACHIRNMSVWPTLGTFYFEQGALELGCTLTKAESHQENVNLNPQQPPRPPVSTDTTNANVRPPSQIKTPKKRRQPSLTCLPCWKSRKSSKSSVPSQPFSQSLNPSGLTATGDATDWTMQPSATTSNQPTSALGFSMNLLGQSRGFTEESDHFGMAGAVSESNGFSIY